MTSAAGPEVSGDVSPDTGAQGRMEVGRYTGRAPDTVGRCKGWVGGRGVFETYSAVQCRGHSTPLSTPYSVRRHPYVFYLLIDRTVSDANNIVLNSMRQGIAGNKKSSIASRTGTRRIKAVAITRYIYRDIHTYI